MLTDLEDNTLNETGHAVLAALIAARFRAAGDPDADFVASWRRLFQNNADAQDLNDMARQGRELLQARGCMLPSP